MSTAHPQFDSTATGTEKHRTVMRPNPVRPNDEANMTEQRLQSLANPFSETPLPFNFSCSFLVRLRREL